jgi:hypothetical protein
MGGIVTAATKAPVKAKRRCVMRDGLFVEPCDALRPMLTAHPMPARWKGFRLVNLKNMETWKPTRSYVGLKFPPYMDAPALVSFCPFCGVEIGISMQQKTEAKHG